MPVIQVGISDKQNKILNLYKASLAIKSNDKAIQTIIDSILPKEIEHNLNER